jgi:hypothetical protein
MTKNGNLDAPRHIRLNITIGLDNEPEVYALEVFETALKEFAESRDRTFTDRLDKLAYQLDQASQGLAVMSNADSDVCWPSFLSTFEGVRKKLAGKAKGKPAAV